MIDLTDSVALITGASRGIGRACAVEMARAGADIVVNYRSHPDDAAEAVGEIEALGRRAIPFQADVSDRAAVDAMVEATFEHFGRIDILVANAYASTREPFLEITGEGYAHTLNVSLHGAFHAAQAVSRKLVSQGGGGAICFISSVHAFTPVAGSLAYNTAKAGMNHMAATIAAELASHKIRVNVIEPGWIDTPGERVYATEDELVEAGKKLPWGRLGRPEEVGRTAAFLCSPAAEYITGVVLRVDGGYWLKKTE